MPRKEKTSTIGEVVTREYTINLHKALHGITFKKRAPKAVSYVRARLLACQHGLIRLILKSVYAPVFWPTYKRYI